MGENDWTYALTCEPMARIPQAELDGLRGAYAAQKALVKRWRENANECVKADAGAHAFAAGMRRCAVELEAATEDAVILARACR